MSTSLAIVTTKKRTDEEVGTWLREMLADGPREKKMHATKQMYRVMEQIGIVEKASGPKGGLYWHLPEHKDVIPVSGFGAGNYVEDLAAANTPQPAEQSETEKVIAEIILKNKTKFDKDSIIVPNQFHKPDGGLTGPTNCRWQNIGNFLRLLKAKYHDIGLECDDELRQSYFSPLSILSADELSQLSQELRTEYAGYDEIAKNVLNEDARSTDQKEQKAVEGSYEVMKNQMRRWAGEPEKTISPKSVTPEIAALEVLLIDTQGTIAAHASLLKVNVIEAGRIISELKALFSHGDWMPYSDALYKRVGISRKTADRYKEAFETVKDFGKPLVEAAEAAGLNLGKIAVRDALNFVRNENAEATPEEIVNLTNMELEKPKTEPEVKVFVVDELTATISNLSFAIRTAKFDSTTPNLPKLIRALRSFAKEAIEVAQKLEIA